MTNKQFKLIVIKKVTYFSNDLGYIIIILHKEYYFHTLKA